MAPLDGLDWVAVLVAMAWSLFFLLSNLWGVIAEHLSKEKMLPLLAFIAYVCGGWFNARRGDNGLTTDDISILLSASHLVWAILVKLLFF
jgi:hypothetical protein